MSAVFSFERVVQGLFNHWYIISNFGAVMKNESYLGSGSPVLRFGTRFSLRLSFVVLLFLFSSLPTGLALAVTSKITRHSSSVALLKGQV